MQIQDGLQIALSNNTNQSSIIAIDPLEWEKTMDCKKIRTGLVVYKKDCELRLLYTCHQGKTGYVTKEKKKRARNKFNECSIDKMASDGFTYYSQMEHKSCYNTDEDWNINQEYIHAHFKTLPGSDRAQRDHMGGKYWRRNEKRIMRANIGNPNKGDKARYKYVTNSRHELCFDHNMDDFIKVLINKSKLNEDQICDAVKNTTDYLENEFANLMYYTFEPTLEPTNSTTTTMTMTQPAVISVPSYTKNALTITQGKRILIKWLESREKQPELEKTVESIIIKYQDMSAEQQTKFWFQFTTLQIKFDLLMFLIDNKYGAGQPEQDMLGGGELFRQHSLEFPSV